MIARAKASLAELPPSAAKFVEPLLQRAASLMRNHASLREAREQFRELLEPLRARPLPEFVGAVQEYLGAEVSLLFVLDQFEELFVHYYNTAPILSSSTTWGRLRRMERFGRDSYSQCARTGWGAWWCSGMRSPIS